MVSVNSGQKKKETKQSNNAIGSDTTPTSSSRRSHVASAGPPPPVPSRPRAPRYHEVFGWKKQQYPKSHNKSSMANTDKKSTIRQRKKTSDSPKPSSQPTEASTSHDTLAQQLDNAQNRKIRVLFIHGLASSPTSRKARNLKRSFKVHSRLMKPLGIWAWCNRWMFALAILVYTAMRLAFEAVQCASTTIGVVSFVGYGARRVLSYFGFQTTTIEEDGVEWVDWLGGDNVLVSDDCWNSTAFFSRIPIHTYLQSWWVTVLVIFFTLFMFDVVRRWMWEKAVGDVIEQMIQIQVEAVAEFCPDVVVGSSFGGGIACHMMARGIWNGPTVLLAPAFRAACERSGMQMTRSMGAAKTSMKKLEESAQQATQDQEGKSGLEAALVLRTRGDLAEYQRILLSMFERQTPSRVLIVHGHNDDTIPVAHSIEMHEMYRSSVESGIVGRALAQKIGVAQTDIKQCSALSKPLLHDLFELRIEDDDHRLIKTSTESTLATWVLAVCSPGPMLPSADSE
jgi:Uncharacterised protein family (UPF0227)